MNLRDAYLPFSAKIIERTQEAPDVFTLKLQFVDKIQREIYRFLPGQFNMLYLFGVGEIAISIVSSEINAAYTHTIRRLGRVTTGLSKLKVGDEIGVRGPFGSHWPLKLAQNKDVIIVTGGLGCAPSVSIIKYINRNRGQYGKVTILQGVKHSDDFIFKNEYDKWAKTPNIDVFLAADMSSPKWPGYTGLVTELIDKIKFDPRNTIAMMCGPEGMMRAAVNRLYEFNLPLESMYLSLERNMECAIGHCGHCQFGGSFVCKDGPIFCYPDIQQLMGVRGF